MQTVKKKNSVISVLENISLKIKVYPNKNLTDIQFVGMHTRIVCSYILYRLCYEYINNNSIRYVCYYTSKCQ